MSSPHATPPPALDTDAALYGKISTRLTRAVNKSLSPSKLSTPVNITPEKHPAGEVGAYTVDPAGTVTITNPAQAFPVPRQDWINPASWFFGRRRHPSITGLTAHLAAHAAHHASALADTSLPPQVRAALSWLDEPRINYQHLIRHPQDATYLRAATQTRPLPKASSSYPLWRPAALALNTFAAIDAGVTQVADSATAMARINHVIEPGRMKTLTTIWRAYMAIRDPGDPRLTQLAAEWCQACDVPIDSPIEGLPVSPCITLTPASSPPDDSSGSGGDRGDDASGEEAGSGDEEGAGETCEPDASGTSGESGNDSGEGETAQPSDGGSGDSESESGDESGQTEQTDQPSGATTMGGDSDDMLVDEYEQAQHDTARNAAEEADPTLAPPTRRQTEAAEAAQERNKHHQEKRQAQIIKADSEIVGKNIHDPRLPERPPTIEERRLANQVEAAFRKAKFRERTTMIVPAAMPPGRLNAQQGMLMSAQRSMGLPETARPFRSKVSRYSPEPPITFGLMVDTSGSMGWAMGPVESISWAFAKALSATHDRFASVAFGNAAIPLVAPGHTPRMVCPLSASSSTENFSAAFTYINGVLNLTTAKGVKVLAVITDGRYNKDQKQAAVEAVTRLRRWGVIILWVSIADTSLLTTVIKPTVLKASFEQASAQIGPEAARARLQAISLDIAKSFMWAPPGTEPLYLQNATDLPTILTRRLVAEARRA